VKVKELDEAMVETVVHLWERAGVTRPWNDPHEDYVRALRGSTSSVLGAFDGDELIGTAMVGADGHRGWVYYVAVSPSHQRHGVGRLLMQSAEQWLKERQVPKIQLIVRDSNAVAVGFYERLGYRDAKTVVLGRWLHEVQ
jgi:ribosomal protein S18 acetylase RimI-like enzyme